MSGVSTLHTDVCILVCAVEGVKSCKAPHQVSQTWACVHTGCSQNDDGSSMQSLQNVLVGSLCVDMVSGKLMQQYQSVCVWSVCVCGVRVCVL